MRFVTNWRLPVAKTRWLATTTLRRPTPEIVIMLRKDLTVTATASLEKTATVFAAVRMFSTNVGFVVGTTVTAWMIAVFPTATTALVQTPAVSLMVTTALVLMIVEFPLVTTRHASWDALMNQRCNYNPQATVESSSGVNPSTADLILTISQAYDDDGNLVTENFYVLGQGIYEEDDLNIHLKWVCSG